MVDNPGTFTQKGIERGHVQAAAHAAAGRPTFTQKGIESETPAMLFMLHVEPPAFTQKGIESVPMALTGLSWPWGPFTQKGIERRHPGAPRERPQPRHSPKRE